MSNLLEKLRELNNEDAIEVPADFRKKIISELESKKATISKFMYIISGVSVAAVALIAITFARGSNRELNRIESADNYLNDDAFFVSTENVAESSDLSTTRGELLGDYANMNDAVALTPAKDSTEKNLQEYKEEIIEMLKINKINAEILSDGRIKAKAKKEDIEMILYYFNGEIEIEEDGNYCYIKEL